MTSEETEKIAKIMLTADGWCSTCQHSLFEQLKAAFPEHTATIEAVWEKRESLEVSFNAVQEKHWDGD